MDKLINELTQKDENKALVAAASIINNKNIQAFQKLCEKTDFLFDFVINNVCKRFNKVINNTNYKNVISFFDTYNEAYASTLIEAICKFADEELTDEIYDLLENGSLNQKKYAAKYFQFIPDTIALELLEKNAFSEDIELSINCSQALGIMNDEEFYNSTITKLNTSDEFEQIKIVRFLSAYGNKNAVKDLLNIIETSATAENIAGEIPYLSPFTEMLKTQDINKVLSCFDLVINSLGEIFNLKDIFFYEIYEVLEFLINKQNNENNSHIAQVLLRAYEKFATFTSNDEYLFDEDKNTKEEIKAIYDLLNSQDNNFWNNQKLLISEELKQSKQRAVATLETIQSLNILETKDNLINFINNISDEQLIVLSVGVAKSLNITSMLNFTELSKKISDETLKAILNSYSI